MYKGNPVDGNYYDNHSELACYYCMINASDASLPSGVSNEKQRAYYTALAREKYRLVRLSSYINGSGKQIRI